MLAMLARGIRESHFFFGRWTNTPPRLLERLSNSQGNLLEDTELIEAGL
jgi:hypothetical protein